MAALLAAAALLPPPARAQVVDLAPLEFRDAAEAERFHDLAVELRCVKCQNQSLADSDAAIARDLRNEVLGLIRQGRSDAEIKDYLVARYGEFVLYRPAIQASTWLLWFGPALLLLGGAGLVAWTVSRRARALPRSASRPADEQEW
ncbi:cytochrome c-type biogenesis protein CcmH [Lysobacter sp. GX 14042]|uniref:cytochrome c-type biogenesis protein n=1 Tax=Lysobacter sp. GX 14042 TaxID=2907155 RepID=UPI001F196E11|nr:cytochrome c-type biogenesis protein [Lysobacter sp. GX 14042]MCE7031220.1 cytochrome c-type biogenesis protein CcmH [Lysobacter sp. GX 14042]